MRNILYCIVIIVTMWPILTALLFDDPCEISTTSIHNENKTTDIFANRSCINGSVHWAYPRGSLRIHFESQDSEVFTVCFFNWLAGGNLTFFDASTGIEHKMAPLGEKGHSMTCTNPHSKEVIVRIQAPEALVYVICVLYQMKLAYS